MKPSIGRIVIYNATEEEKKAMADGKGNVQKHLPAVIVAVWGDMEDSVVNLKVILDGPGEIWKTSVPKGDAPGQWNWPVIQK